VSAALAAPPATPAPETDGGEGEDAALVARLRRGDEAAFRSLVERHHSAMVRVAMAHVPSRAVAEEVVQETWLGVVRGLDRFEGRSSLKTWIFRIVVNRAKTRGVSERRCVAFSDLPAHGDEEAGVDPERFVGEGHPGAGHWVSQPRPFGDLTANGVLSAELRSRIGAAIDALAPRQRQVITLRDVEGWSSAEVCAALGLTEANQRVLLHRARSSVRASLERYLDASTAA
jgi:RNA polymerase sigma-70 factor (ECF subfamily)